MKRSKLLELIREVRAETLIEPKYPVTFDQLEVNFVKRTVRFKGRTIEVKDTDAIVFPLLSTDRMIILPRGAELL